MIQWFNSQPKSDWEEKEGLKTMGLLAPLDVFGMILSKRDSVLSLFLGTIPTDVHHIAAIPDITSVPCELPDVFFEQTYDMKLRYDYIHPLCVMVEECKMYEQLGLLGDFSFGIIGNRANAMMLRKRAKSHMEKLKNKSPDTRHTDITKPIEFKVEQNHLFACEVFFSCPKSTKESFLSSINFTRRLAVPNGLVSKRRKNTQKILKSIPSLPWIGGKKTPILSLVEIVSILSFPPTLFGLEMKSGADKTFSNLRGGTDPASFFENGNDEK